MNDLNSRPNNATAIRGVLLVIVAVAIGVFLLRGDNTPVLEVEILDASPSTTMALGEVNGSTATTTPSGSSSEEASEDLGDTTATTIAAANSDDMNGFVPRANNEVSIQVANSTSVRGAAGKMNDQFKTLGYITKTPTNLLGAALDRTRISYVAGNMLEAQKIAEELGLDPKNDVFRMPADTAAFATYAEPDVMISLGIDKAE
jgi:hypothetical protein|tara:strand:+ start:269 stop:877 length:609 start_codon:yes stop_codon:yes gene_type:complete